MMFCLPALHSELGWADVVVGSYIKSATININAITGAKKTVLVFLGLGKGVGISHA